MIGPDLEHLIKKLLQGKCTEEELDILFKSVPDLPAVRKAEVMDALWKHAQAYPKLKQAHSSKMYTGILSRIQVPEKQTPSRTAQPNSRRRILRWTAAAAVFLALISAALWAFPKQELHYQTAFADRQTIELPDGSMVTLNANSSIHFKKQWDKEEDRRVWLEGEAFFEVEKKPATGQKFQVITSDLTVEVLGTVFNVHSRQAQTSVFLEEGKVALELKDHPEGNKTMEPGELLTYSAEQHSILENKKNTTALVHTSWKDGVLTFEETPLLEVLLKIEEIYGIRFEVKTNENLQREITTGLPMEALELVIPMLEQALGLQIEKTDEHFIVQ